MNRFIPPLVLAAASLFGAAPATPTDPSKPQLVTFTATPLYDPAGTLVSLHVTAKFRVPLDMPNGQTKTPGIRSIDFDLIQGQEAMIGNQIVNYRDIADDILGVSAFAWKLQNPDPLPVHRRSLREQASGNTSRMR
jgi:hypothetical protein